VIAVLALCTNAGLAATLPAAVATALKHVADECTGVEGKPQTKDAVNRPT
jgi:hypothetical protein